MYNVAYSDAKIERVQAKGVNASESKKSGRKQQNKKNTKLKGKRADLTATRKQKNKKQNKI